MSKWYKKSSWRNLVDMHINDKTHDFMGKFDPQTYADNMETAGVDASELYLGNCLGICFFPTEVGHMHKGLHGRDIIAPTLDAIHKKGIHRIAYFNAWCRWGFDTHPSWRLLDVHGRNSCEVGFGGQGRYGVCCPNNEEFRAYFRQQIEYICTHYDFEGMWIDMIGWLIAVCHCPTCREKFKRATGLEMPKKMDWKDPAWLKLQKLRQQWSVEFLHVVDDTARAIKPDVTIAYQVGEWRDGWQHAVSDEFLQLGDYAAADIYNTPLVSSFICKSMASFSRNKPFEYMTSRCTCLEQHTISRSKDEMRLQVYSAMANNAAFTFIDAIDPAGTMDARLYAMLGELKKEFDPYFRYWRPDAVLQRDVTLYMNQDSLFDPYSQDMTQGFPVEAKMKIPAATLIAGHYAFDICMKPSLQAACEKSKVIVLQNTYMLDESEAALLRGFVKRGGSLISVGLSGMYSWEGFREDFMLSDVLGVHYRGETVEDITYIRPEPKFAHVMPAFNSTYPMAVVEHAVKIAPDADTEILGRLTLPYSTRQENDFFASAISDPPGIDTDEPVVTLHKYGAGKAMYISMPLQMDASSAVRQVFRNIIDFMMPAPRRIEVQNAPDWLELILNKAEDFYQLSAYNAMDAFYVAEARDIDVKIRMAETPISVCNAQDDSPVEFDYADGVLSLRIDRVDPFKMLIIRI